MTRPLRRTLGILTASALALVLAGCSRHTAWTVQADLVPFLNADSTQTTVPYGAGAVTIDLPPNTTPPQAGALVDLAKLGVPQDAFADVDQLGFDVAATVTPTSAVGTGSATLFIADTSATDVFQAPYAVAHIATAALAANRSSTLTASFSVDAHDHAAALARVQSGSFRIGVEITASTPAGGSVQVDVTRLLVSVTLPPGWGLP